METVSNEKKIAIEQFVNQECDYLSECKYQADMEEEFTEWFISEYDEDPTTDENLYFIDCVQRATGIDCSQIPFNPDEEEVSA